MPRSSRPRALLCWLLLAATPADADEIDKLIESINAYRSRAQVCENQQRAAAPPLAPQPLLAKAVSGPAPESPQKALEAVGYAAARVQWIVLTGPATAADAMRLLRQRYCRAIRSDRFAEIGVTRTDRTWRIALAQPLLSPKLGDWQAAGKEILQRVNQARGEPRTCGDKRFDAAPPLAWDAKLAAAAVAHSSDMAKRNYFAHAGKGGNTVAQRASSQGYRWRRVGENIAAGQGSPAQVVSSWLSSPHHCANIMEGGFTEMGAAYAINLDNRANIYWTQVFGTPR